jgi:hypothetical protein
MRVCPNRLPCGASDVCDSPLSLSPRWRLLIFPNGNRVENVLSVYLDFVGPDTRGRGSCALPAASSSAQQSSAQASDAPLSAQAAPGTGLIVASRDADAEDDENETMVFAADHGPFCEPAPAKAAPPRASSVVEARVFFSVLPPPPATVFDDSSSGVISTAATPWSSSSSSSASKYESESSRDAQEAVQLKECSHRFTEPDNDWGFRELMGVARAKRYTDDAGRLSLRAKVHVYSQVYTQVRDKVMQASSPHVCNWLEIVPLVQEHEGLAANAPTRTGLADHNDGASLLHVACKAGNRAYAALLLARGAVLEVEDDSGRSPLFYATRAGRICVIEWLVDDLDMNVNARDSDGRTPLFYACEEGRTAIAKLLIARGAEPGIADSVGETPARLAEDNGYDELAAMLRDI